MKIKSKGKTATLPGTVVRDVPMDVKIDRMLLSPSRLIDSNGISFGRLEEIEIEIARGAPIDAELRNEIRQLIGHVLSLHDAERGRGSPVQDAGLGQLARIAGALHENHKIPLAEAARALVHDPECEEGFNRAKAIERAYRRLRKIGGHYLVGERLVQQTLARILARKAGA